MEVSVFHADQRTVYGSAWADVTTELKCGHQSWESIIFSSRRAGTMSRHSWFLYERAVEAIMQKQSKGIFIQQPCGPQWILHSSWSCPFTIGGEHCNVHNHASHNNSNVNRYLLICLAKANLTGWEAFINSDESARAHCSHLHLQPQNIRLRWYCITCQHCQIWQWQNKPRVFLSTGSLRRWMQILVGWNQTDLL